MTAGEIAGLIAAGAFLLLVVLCAVPLLKLGRVLDELRLAVRGVGDSSVPILHELRGTVEATNVELEKLAVVTEDAARVSGHATVVSENAAQVASLFTATVSVPLRRTAAIGQRVRRALGPARPTRSAGTTQTHDTAHTRERD